MDVLGLPTPRVAHDRNDVPHVMCRSVTILRRRIHDANAEVLCCLEMIRRNIDRAAMSARKLLALAGQPALTPKPVDLNELITRMYPSLKQIVGRNIVIGLKLSPDLLLTYLDRQGLEAALVDLAVSAQVAMNGRGTLTLETINVGLDKAEAARGRNLKPSGYALITVRDSGLTASQDARVFELLFTTTNLERLAQVEAFARDSGGYLTVEGDASGGTTVKVYFPRYTEAPARKPLA